MNQIIVLILVVIGGVLLFSPDSVIDKDTKDERMKMVYNNAMVLGLLSVGAAYYLYASHTDMQTELPSYEEAISSN